MKMSQKFLNKGQKKWNLIVKNFSRKYKKKYWKKYLDNVEYKYIKIHVEIQKEVHWKLNSCKIEE